MSTVTHSKLISTYPSSCGNQHLIMFACARAPTRLPTINVLKPEWPANGRRINMPNFRINIKAVMNTCSISLQKSQAKVTSISFRSQRSKAWGGVGATGITTGGAAQSFRTCSAAAWCVSTGSQITFTQMGYSAAGDGKPWVEHSFQPGALCWHMGLLASPQPMPLNGALQQVKQFLTE